MFTTSVQLPSGSTQQQTLKVVQKAEDYFLNNEKQNVESVFATVGSGPGGNGQNVARMFVRLKDWDQRDPQTGTSFAIIERATKALIRLTKRGLSPAARRRSAASAVRQASIWSWRIMPGRGTMR